MLGVYADSGGQPGALLAQCSLSGTAAGRGQWHECAASPGTVMLAAGNAYWLAVLSPAGGAPVLFRDTATGGVSVGSAQAALAALPAQWQTGSTFANGPVAAYAVGR